ncbi:verprolin [Raphanus sativus]|uniref:Verprolin n=1 Tax=Raphanus sativus TaxID=3726 RepID=A0A6J0JHB0_RAPSA|nr:verprolin [Raphanus sativus]
MTSSVTTLALTLVLIFHLTPETTVARHLNDQKPTDEMKYLFPPGLPFTGVPPLPTLFPPFPGNVPRFPFPLPSQSSPPASLPGLPGVTFPPLPFLTPPPE